MHFSPLVVLHAGECIMNVIINPALSYGGRSSVVERLSVEEDVAGSNPVGHPKSMIPFKQDYQIGFKHVGLAIILL